MEFTVFQFASYAPPLVLPVTEKSVSFTPTHQYLFTHTGKIPRNLLISRLKNPNSPSLSLYDRGSEAFTIKLCGPEVDPLWYVPVELSCTGEPSTGHNTVVCHTRLEQRGRITSLDLMGNALPHVLLAHVQCAVYQVLSCKAPFQLAGSSLHRCMGLLLPRCKEMAFLCVELQEV